MPYAHKLAVYEDTPHVKTVYCSVCGQEDKLSGPCIGPFVDKNFEQNFAEIFGSAPVKASKELKNILAYK